MGGWKLMAAAVGLSCFATLCVAAGGVSSQKDVIPGSGDDVVVTSPHGVISVAVGVTGEGRLSYVVHADGKEVVGVSPLGMYVEGEFLGEHCRVSGPPVVREIHETYPTFGAHALAHNDCQEATIPLICNAIKYSITVRAYDDGIALRYEFDGKESRINGETTGWNLPRDGRYTWAAYDNSYENIVHTTGWEKLPVIGVLAPPLTAEVAGHFVAIAEANNQNFPDMGLSRVGDTFRTCYPASPKGWMVNEDHVVTPWRATIITSDLTALVNSDLITNLCPPSDPTMDFSWVKPGRCLWQWCSVGAPQLQDQHDWYDAAVKLKWEYYLIDDGWRNWKQDGKNQWELLKEVISYGNSKGIKTLVWVNSAEMRDPKASRAYLEKVKDCGAVGIKIDFFPPATPDVIRWQLELLKQTADLHLLCNFHGAVKPSGLRRTWPNELTREAVRGDEYQMTKYKRLRPMEMDCNQPFNRYLVGPADITPVVLDPRELRGYTWPHMIAQALVTYSPVTHFYDQYKFYVSNPAEDLFADMPVVWDETRVLPGTVIGQVAGFARRKGNDWWIGIVNGGKESELHIPLSFLDKPAQATLLFDAPSKDDAMDRQEKTLGPADALTLKLRPGGGFVARIRG